MNERTEAWMRLLIGIVSGIIICVWGTLVKVLIVIHWIYALWTKKRSKDIAEFCHLWTANAYDFMQYMTFMTNKRVFPWAPLSRPMAKFEK